MSARKTFTAPLSVGLPLFLLLVLLQPVAEVAGLHMAPDEFERLEAKCQQTHNVSAAELENIPRDVQPGDVDMKFKCFAHCILAGLDYLDEAGKLDVEKLRSYEDTNDEQMESVMECKAANDMEDDPCEYSFGILACSRMAMPDSEGEELDSADEDSDE